MAYVVCDHGSLKRACRECDYIEDIKELKAEIRRLETELKAANRIILQLQSFTKEII